MKKILALILALFMVVGTFVACESQDIEQESDNTQVQTAPNGYINEYELDFYPLPDGTYGVRAGRSIYLEKIVIPEYYNGKKVTTILSDAFTKYGGSMYGTTPSEVLKEIVIPESIVRIEIGAFHLDGELKSAEFSNTNGWKIEDTGESISSSDLSNKEIAAKYLVDDYCSYTWIRSEKTD